MTQKRAGPPGALQHGPRPVSAALLALRRAAAGHPPTAPRGCCWGQAGAAPRQRPPGGSGPPTAPALPPAQPDRTAPAVRGWREAGAEVDLKWGAPSAAAAGPGNPGTLRSRGPALALPSLAAPWAHHPAAPWPRTSMPSLHRHLPASSTAPYLGMSSRSTSAPYCRKLQQGRAQGRGPEAQARSPRCNGQEATAAATRNSRCLHPVACRVGLAATRLGSPAG